MVRVGCVGFPVGRDRYWRTLSFVEAKTGERMPRPETLADWRSGAPPGAEFSLQAFRTITHGREDRGFPPAARRFPVSRQQQCGAFRDSLEVHEAWSATRFAAEALGARIILFETPASFQPGPDRLRDMYRFFKNLSRGRSACVWRPSGGAWKRSLIEKVCADLGLIFAFDPLRESCPQRGAFRYMRPLGPRLGTLSEDSLSAIRRLGDAVPAYLVFSHRGGFCDAERLLQGGRGPGARGRP